MLKKIITLFALCIFISPVFAQELLTPTFQYSHKKTAYITLADGTEIKGTLKDVDRKKGLIEEIKIVDLEGKKHKLTPDQVKHMYLPPSGLDKLGKAIDFLNDARRWTDDKLDQDLLGKNYAYFENSKVQVKKKQLTLLVQLLNPTFSKSVKIYHDPMAGETASIGVGPIKAGGIAKSYYVKVVGQSDVATRLKKKDYSAEFKPMWGSCEAVVAEYASPKWRDLSKHAVKFSECGAESKEGTL
ncbi:YgdI/YgdR family lipoprotein [Sediminitomix flava]|uniref:Uncharacterized protein n=1 Tax=Sediminitomix flava TaxID=379075 RepID=A0A315ZC53_SEDFL|nr:hypothetical protein [Sediminitomix flava]PWJ42892.1 hypothetical protein BC781_102438 [Sediminitomix flava]